MGTGGACAAASFLTMPLAAYVCPPRGGLGRSTQTTQPTRVKAPRQMIVMSPRADPDSPSISPPMMSLACSISSEYDREISGAGAKLFRSSRDMSTKKLGSSYVDG